jgi:hypothetical protein
MKKETPKRLETRRTINGAGRTLLKNIYGINKDIGFIAGEFMALNEEYVLNHSGEEETNGTVDILQTGFTTNQKDILERLRKTITDEEKIKEINFIVGAVDGKTLERVKRFISYLKLYQWAYGELQLADTQRRRDEIEKKLRSGLREADLPLGIKYD